MILDPPGLATIQNFLAIFRYSLSSMFQQLLLRKGTKTP